MSRRGQSLLDGTSLCGKRLVAEAQPSACRALRERKEDIGPLVRHFTEKRGQRPEANVAVPSSLAGQRKAASRLRISYEAVLYKIKDRNIVDPRGSGRVD